LFKRLAKEACQLRGECVSIANSSDPYPIVESKLGITRKCLEKLSASDCRIQITTKSNLVTRDADLLAKVPSAVALTITTQDDRLSKLLEPHAPSPTERLKAAEFLVKKGIAVSARIDPIIPFMNDNPDELVEVLSNIGVKHITSSTYKAKADNWGRFASVFPENARRLRAWYFDEGEKIGGNHLLPKDIRLKLMKGIRDVVTAKGLKFGVCREGLSELNTATCDGSWLLFGLGGKRE
jgi:DNA repair photolyase